MSDKISNGDIMIKLLAVDMDGTCLDSRSKMSEKNVNALKKAAEKGIIVVPTTGRNLNCIPYRLKSECFYRYVITSNGACVIDKKIGKNIFSSFIPFNTAAELLSSCRHQGFGITAQLENDYYLQGKLLSLVGRLYYGKDSDNSLCVKNLEEFIRNRGSDIEEIQLYFLHPKAKERAEKILSNYNGFSAAYSSIYVEIFNHNASKGIALSNLSDYLGIKKDEVACIGDGENDLTMFSASGMKFAMGNAVDILKEKSDHVLPDNNHNGVAFAIENYIL